MSRSPRSSSRQSGAAGANAGMNTGLGAYGAGSYGAYGANAGGTSGVGAYGAGAYGTGLSSYGAGAGAGGRSNGSRGGGRSPRTQQQSPRSSRSSSSSRSPRSSGSRQSPRAGAAGGAGGSSGYDAFSLLPDFGLALAPPAAHHRGRRSRQEEDEEDIDASEDGVPRVKRKFFVCDKHGCVKKVCHNRFPANAAKKGATMGLTEILVYDSEKKKWYRYIGHRIKLKPKDRIKRVLKDGRAFEIKYKSKVTRDKRGEAESHLPLGVVFEEEGKRSGAHRRSPRAGRQGAAAAAALFDAEALQKPRVRAPRLADFGLSLDTLPQEYLYGPRGGRLSGRSLIDNLIQHGIIPA